MQYKPRKQLPLFCLILAGCNTQAGLPVPGVATPAPDYALTEKATLRFSAETLATVGSYVGTAVLKRQTSRKITFVLPKGTSDFYIQSCHREVSLYKPPETFVWNYVPTMALLAPEPIEYAGNCMIIATAITAKGKVLRGLISFSGDETAPAKAYCNGEATDVVGHTLCQSRAGHVQALVFNEPMRANWKDNCTDLRTKDNKGWAWDIAQGLCTYAFVSYDKQRWFRLTTYGYNNVSLPDYE